MDVAGDDFQLGVSVRFSAAVVDRYPAGQVKQCFVGIEHADIFGLPIDSAGLIAYDSTG